MIVLQLLWETFLEWQEDAATRQGAALAFYGLFACAPLLLMASAVLGAVLGEQAAEKELAVQLEFLMTPELAATVQGLVHNAGRGSEWAAGTVGLLTLLYGGARGMFHLQATLNLIWGVRANRQGTVLVVVWRHLLAFGSVLLCGLLLLASVVGTVVLHSFAERAAERLPQSWALLRASQELGTFLLVLLLISVIFKTLSDARVRWRDVLLGAAASAALFLIGKQGMAIYLREVGAGSTFGAAGAVIAVLMYAYYSAQVVLFGAEVTFVVARHLGDPIEPGPNAVRVSRTYHPN